MTGYYRLWAPLMQDLQKSSCLGLCLVWWLFGSASCLRFILAFVRWILFRRTSVSSQLDRMQSSEGRQLDRMQDSGKWKATPCTQDRQNATLGDKISHIRNGGSSTRQNVMLAGAGLVRMQSFSQMESNSMYTTSQNAIVATKFFSYLFKKC